MKIATIHQSQYLPWAPYFKKVAIADVFVVMDDVQFQKNGVQNRNKIRNKNGDFWLTIPVTGQLEDTIREKKIADARWAKKHWKSIQGAYQKAPYWHCYAEELEWLYQQSYRTLFEANDAFFRFFMKHLGIQTEVVYLSQLNVGGRKSELVLEICKVVEADIYISGTGGRSYLDEKSFKREGIEIVYQEAVSPVYEQFHGTFISGLSMLDMIMNVDITKIQKYLF